MIYQINTLWQPRIAKLKHDSRNMQNTAATAYSLVLLYGLIWLPKYAEHSAATAYSLVETRHPKYAKLSSFCSNSVLLKIKLFPKLYTMIHTKIVYTVYYDSI